MCHSVLTPKIPLPINITSRFYNKKDLISYMSLTRVMIACLQAVTGGFIANPYRLLIGRYLGFLRRALPGTSGRAQKSREGGGGWKGKTTGFSPLSPSPSSRSLCQHSTRPRPSCANSRWRPHYEFQFFFRPSNRLGAG